MRVPFMRLMWAHTYRRGPRIKKASHKTRPPKTAQFGFDYLRMRGRCVPKPITCYCVFVVSVFAPSACAGAVLASFALSVLDFAALVSTAVFLLTLCGLAV